MNPKQHSTETLKQDLIKVENNKQQFNRIERNIDDYVAPTEKVLQWYYAQDSHDEQWYIDNALATKRTLEYKGGLAESWQMMVEADQYAMRKASLYNKGSIILLSNLLYPTLIGTENTHKNLEFAKICSEVDPYELITDLSHKIKDVKTYQKEDIVQIGVAAEMLLLAAQQKSFTGDVGASLGDGFLGRHVREVKERAGYNQTETISKKDRKRLIDASRSIYEKAFSATHEHLDNPVMAKLCVQMLIMRDAIKMNVSKPRSKNARKTLGQLLEACESLLDNKSLENLDQGELKGFWHETLWYLDFNMLKQVKKHRLFIFPAMTCQDRPHNDYPKMNRGFDYSIGGKWFQRRIQLKSSPKANKGKDYHPLIDVVTEEGFEFNHQKLREKFVMYEKYLDSGFNNYFAEEIMAQILTSVKKVVEDNSLEQRTLLSNNSSYTRINQMHGVESPNTALDFLVEMKKLYKDISNDAQENGRVDLLKWFIPNQQKASKETRVDTHNEDTLFLNRAMKRAMKNKDVKTKK